MRERWNDGTTGVYGMISQQLHESLSADLGTGPIWESALGRNSGKVLNFVLKSGFEVVLLGSFNAVHRANKRKQLLQRFLHPCWTSDVLQVDCCQFIEHCRRVSNHAA